MSTADRGEAAPLRVAVVGAGGWGEHHSRVFAGRTDTELVAVVGRTWERTAARAARSGTAAYTDLDRMLAEQRPDLVSVSLPNEEHFAPTLHLIEAGVPLLVEKPLVFELAEADRLIAAAAERDLFFAIDFNHRYAEPFLRAKAAIDAGELGAPVSASWRFGGEGRGAGSPHANLIETQCHGFDLLEHLMGPIASVAAQFRRRDDGELSTVAIALEFDSGAVGSLLGSYDWSYAWQDTQRVEIEGTAGRLRVHDTVREFELTRAGDPVAAVWRAGYFDDEARHFAGTFDRYVDAMLAAFRAGSPPPVPATAGRRALRLALACVESWESGRRVPTPPGGEPA